MKIIWILLACLLGYLPIAEANSGSSVRGGGKAAVCRDANGDVESVELLDLWEARVLRKRTIQYSDAPVEVQVREAIQRMKTRNTGFYTQDFFNLMEKVGLGGLEQSANAFFGGTPRNLTVIERLRNVTLSWTEDSFEVASPAKCKLEQVAAKGTDALYINEDLFEKMNPTNQAALIVHEMIYSMEAYFQMKTPNSLRSRRAVGYVFSGGNFNERPPSHLPHYTCEATNKKQRAEFSLYNDPATGTLMGAVFGGFEEEFTGFFPRKVRDLNDTSRSLDTILSDQQCIGQTEGEYFHIAQIGATGPVDFDRSATIFGLCQSGKLQVVFSSENFETDKAENDVPVTCTWNPHGV